ncbi:multisubunit sodium/proton antiporter MrpG subunit [Haloactinopolyspora alba]|uniref:Multisubunit sodium/proton antiporter MrpG subunit n=1 Tax=Haloactinopolyspora alba TaxID=648780 RepID=A0A2P8E2I7_9ACTN|nr:monovalent cation/H(+) antiporter subunit G [Haloactinopolyspora alba]PSL03682.1 multisubunit sodium/proton antiporter MrpG subunit [Haloactinopolyspora alba]
MNWHLIADVVAGVLLLAGALLSLLAAVGLLRFPDLLARMHAGAKPQVLGLLLILVAVGLRLRSLHDIGLLLVIGLAQLLIVPVAAHMVGRSAYRTGEVERDDLLTDELSPAVDESGDD